MVSKFGSSPFPKGTPFSGASRLFSGGLAGFFLQATQKSYPNFCLNIPPRQTAKLGWWIIVEHETFQKTSQKMVVKKIQENIDKTSQNDLIIRVV